MGKWLEMAHRLEAQRGRDVRDNRDKAAQDPSNVLFVPFVPEVAPPPVATIPALRDCRAGLARLDPDKPLGGVAPGRWRNLVTAAGDLFNGWAPQALALGWSALDLFGGPGGLVGRMAEGWRVVAMDEHRAALVGCYSGASGWHYRRSSLRARLLWELAA